ncbi:MAG: hypothetical protein NW226_22595 [Microscillaceae bacterium]|nr:hypothetical protein [Microscillaceae bacterium]
MLGFFSSLRPLPSAESGRFQEYLAQGNPCARLFFWLLLRIELIVLEGSLLAKLWAQNY